MEVSLSQNISFKGVTKIYALADTHQETRKTVSFLTKILKDNKDDKNVLLLHSGDLAKGIYPTELEADAYIKLKDAMPDVEMVMTIGNNDFGFDKYGFGLLIETIKKYAQKGIKIVCANIFDGSGKRPQWLKPYEIVERDGDRNFITGFCIDKISQMKNGLFPKNQMEVIDEILDSVKREKPDNVIILNHDYMPSSQKIVNYCKEKGINIDLVIGGHDHDIVPPDADLHIYHPQAYAQTMYKMDLVNNNGQRKLKNIESVQSDSIIPDKSLIRPVEKYEKESGLLNPVGIRVLNLTKRYSEPCSLGSFLADSMKETASADLGFFSTGFILRPLKYEAGKPITNYDFKRTIVAETPIKTVELSADELKEVFYNALKSNGYGESNPKFLQCSNNVRIIGHNNTQKKCYEVKQIFINDEPVLDGNGNPLKNGKKYKCVIDSFIADGGQGFKTLLNAEKKEVIIDKKPIKINEVLLTALQNAKNKYKAGSEYPHFRIENI